MKRTFSLSGKMQYTENNALTSESARIYSSNEAGSIHPHPGNMSIEEVRAEGVDSNVPLNHGEASEANSSQYQENDNISGALECYDFLAMSFSGNNYIPLQALKRYFFIRLI